MRFLNSAACLAMLVPLATSFQTQLPATSGNVVSLSSTTSTQLSVFVDTNENAPRDVATMEAWATQCGVQKAGGFQLAPNEASNGRDIGVITSEAMPANAPVLSVPAGMILSANNAWQEVGGGQPEAEALLQRLHEGDYFPQFYLFLKVLLEYEKGDQSPWFPWLNSMPRYYENGAAMTPICYECLPPLVAKLAMKTRTRFINFKAALRKVNCLSDATKQNDEVLKWAYNVVCTRAFQSPQDGAWRIVPLADMFNHATEFDVQLQYDAEGNCFAYTTRDVPAGAPLTMLYGDPSNPSQLFATYGFLDETSPATFCKIMNIKPSTELKNLGLDYSRMLFYKDTGEVSAEVWDVLLYTILGEVDKPTQKAFYQAHMNGDVNTKNAIHQQYFLQTSRKLKAHVDSFLEQTDVLSAKAQSKDLREHPRIPTILKHNEFVKRTFMNVKNQLDPMVAQAASQAGQLV